MSRAFAARRAKRCLPKRKYINTLRNRAVHEERTISAGDATGAVKELFHVCFWLARTYARKTKPADGLAFDPSVLSRRDEVLKKAFVQIKAQQAELDAKNGELTKTAHRQAEHRRRVEAASRRRSLPRARRPKRGRIPARLQRGRDPRSLYRPVAARGRLGARQARRHRVSRRGHAEQRRRRLRRLCAVGRGRQAAGAGRGQAHPQGRARRASSRPSFTPIAWRRASASGR